MIRDNDPRMRYRLHYQISFISETHVEAHRSMADSVRIQRKRVYSDDKPRKSGWSVVR